MGTLPHLTAPTPVAAVVVSAVDTTAIAVGATRQFTAVTRSAGGTALTGRDAARWADRADEAGSVLGDGVHELGDRFRAGWTNGSLNAEAMAQALSSPQRDAARALTLELMEMFDGRFYHVITGPDRLKAQKG